MSADKIVDRLDHCRQVREGEWLARCPAHDDRSPSLSIKSLDDGRTLVHCFAGCGVADVIDALGLDMGELFPPDNTNHWKARRQMEKTVDQLVIDIAKADMAKGKKLNNEDKARYALALLKENQL